MNKDTISWAIVILTVLLGLYLSDKARAQEYRGVVIHVVDGDTIHVCKRVFVIHGECEPGAKAIVRIADIDTPEITKAKCDLEKAHGRLIRNYLVQLLLTEHVSVRVRKIDYYKRDFGYVTLRGMDVGTHLLEKGFAKPWPDRAKKPNWCE